MTKHLRIDTFAPPPENVILAHFLCGNYRDCAVCMVWVGHQSPLIECLPVVW